jgi:GH25 family lysozyme M1 (1,4-beta-N-acetylmuramidase)
VDWRQVAADGVEFAMVRLGYRGYSSGAMNLDPFYEQNVKGARDAGLHVGVYFFSQAVTEEEAMDEARFVLRKLRGKRIDGPVAFDMEYIDGAERINHLTVEEKTAIADAFCKIIEENGYQPMIYGNPTWFTEDVNLENLSHRGIWLAHYIEMTQWPFDYWMWQYTDRGTVAGIEGGCDLNIWMEPKN